METQAKIQKGLKPLIDRYPQIKSVYLFGSAAQGLARKDSDVDIAVRCFPDPLPETCFNIRLDLMGAVENALGRESDVVILNEASLKMIRQVLRHGILIYSESPEEESEYAARKQKEYFDFKYYMDKDTKEMKSYYGVT